MKIVRMLMAAVAVILLAGSLVLTYAHISTPESKLWVLATSFSPYALVGFVVALLLLLVARLGAGVAIRRLALYGGVVALVGAVAHAVWLAPLYAGKHPTGKPDLTVMTLNLRFGLGDADKTVELATARKVDVLVLEEVTPEELVKLDADGLNVLLPNRYGTADPGVAGTVISSAYPLEQGKQLAVHNGGYQVRVLAPKPFWLVAVHTGQPLTSLSVWRSDHAAIHQAVAALKGPKIVAGDFNATLNHAPMKALLDLGLHDAAEQANSGWQATWPGDTKARSGFPIPFGLIAIDHVLSSSPFGAISTQVVKIDGTDHKALIAELAAQVS
jgi:endonuclease/exonuclease/phosphatase (EEP) superfamily protein YafD